VLAIIISDVTAGDETFASTGETVQIINRIDKNLWLALTNNQDTLFAVSTSEIRICPAATGN
jgi:hypothetical protein